MQWGSTKCNHVPHFQGVFCDCVLSIAVVGMGLSTGCHSWEYRSHANFMQWS